jgi:hypothetical protein
MLEPQKKIEMLKNKMEESRKTLNNNKTSANPAVAPITTAIVGLIMYAIRITFFFFAINIILDKFKLEAFSFIECFLIFAAIVGISKETAVKQKTNEN